jgi:hypothetical protein
MPKVEELRGTADEVVVKAPSAVITSETQAQINRIQAALEKELMQAATAVEEATIGVGPVIPGLVWNLMSFGPIRIAGVQGPGAPPNRPNKVLSPGNVCVIFGISWAPNPLTQGYLAAQGYTASCSIRNMTTMTPTALTAPIVKAPGPDPVLGLNVLFRVLPFVFVAPPVPAGAGAGTAPHLFEFDFTIDIEGPAAPGFEAAGYANWHFDPDSALAMPGPLGLPGVPAQPAQWRNGMSGRFMVHAFPG